MLQFSKYERPATVEEALAIVQKVKGARVIGGGVWLRLQDRRIARAIDLSACGLDLIERVDWDLSTKQHTSSVLVPWQHLLHLVVLLLWQRLWLVVWFHRLQFLLQLSSSKINSLKKNVTLVYQTSLWVFHSSLKERFHSPQLTQHVQSQALWLVRLLPVPL